MRGATGFTTWHVCIQVLGASIDVAEDSKLLVNETP